MMILAEDDDPCRRWWSWQNLKILAEDGDPGEIRCSSWTKDSVAMLCFCHIKQFSFEIFTFPQHGVPENKAKQRFHKKNRQFYVFATSRRCLFDNSTFSQHWCLESKAKQLFQGQNVRQFYGFATKMAPTRFLSDSSIFWTKNVENAMFSYASAIFLIEAMLEHKRAKK